MSGLSQSVCVTCQRYKWLYTQSSVYIHRGMRRSRRSAPRTHGKAPPAPSSGGSVLPMCQMATGSCLFLCPKLKELFNFSFFIFLFFFFPLLFSFILSLPSSLPFFALPPFPSSSLPQSFASFFLSPFHHSFFLFLSHSFVLSSRWFRLEGDLM